MDIIRAWKDEEYRLSLTEEQRSLLPDNPAGLMELSEGDLGNVIGSGGDDGKPKPSSKILRIGLDVNSLPVLICVG